MLEKIRAAIRNVLGLAIENGQVQPKPDTDGEETQEAQSERLRLWALSVAESKVTAAVAGFTPTVWDDIALAVIKRVAASPVLWGISAGIILKQLSDTDCESFTEEQQFAVIVGEGLS